jgi:integrase
MPVKELMSWEKRSKRWQKKYRGTVYWVSPRQLGVPATREQSASAANEWWGRKQAEIDAEGKQKQDPVWDGIREAVGKLTGGPVNSVEDVCRLFVEKVQSGQKFPDWFQEAILGVERLRQIEAQAKAGVSLALGEVEGERTVGAQIGQWVKLLKASVATRTISEGRWGAYKRYIGVFGKWIGEGAPIDAITAAKLEEYWAWLVSQMTEERFSPATAKGMLMTAKQFIRRLAEVGLIPLPGNIDARRFRFGDGPKKVETLAIEEVRAMLTKATERTRLYVLLMLNCGMYQSDITELGEDEVDWKVGTITRPRSKRPNGPVVRYKLWSETWELLKKHRAKGDRPLNPRGLRVVLTTDQGNLLSRCWIEGDKERRYDTIQSAANTLFETLGWKKPLKRLRKTSSSLLASQKAYKYYVDYFLAHSPKTIAEKSYVAPADEEFFEALTWLRQQYLG